MAGAAPAPAHRHKLHRPLDRLPPPRRCCCGSGVADHWGAAVGDQHREHGAKLEGQRQPERIERNREIADHPVSDEKAEACGSASRGAGDFEASTDGSCVSIELSGAICCGLAVSAMVRASRFACSSVSRIRQLGPRCLGSPLPHSRSRIASAAAIPAHAEQVSLTCGGHAPQRQLPELAAKGQAE